MQRKLIKDIAKIVMFSIVLSFASTLTLFVLSYGHPREFDFGMNIGLLFSVVIPAIVSFPVAYFLLSQKEQMRVLNKELSHLLRYDQLTSCLSRHAFFLDVETALEEASRKKERCAVFFIDLDHFKRVNDTFGHGTGDDVLRLLGKILNEQTQLGEIVARLGGEEFCMFARNCSVDQASVIAQKLVDEFRGQAQVVSGDNVRCTLSVGISVSNRFFDLDMHLIEADTLLYAAKKRGRNRIAMDENPSIESPIAA